MSTTNDFVVPLLDDRDETVVALEMNRDHKIKTGSYSIVNSLDLLDLDWTQATPKCKNNQYL